MNASCAWSPRATRGSRRYDTSDGEAAVGGAAPDELTAVTIGAGDDDDDEGAAEIRDEEKDGSGIIGVDEGSEGNWPAHCGGGALDMAGGEDVRRGSEERPSIELL